MDEDPVMIEISYNNTIYQTHNYSGSSIGTVIRKLMIFHHIGNVGNIVDKIDIVEEPFIYYTFYIISISELLEKTEKNWGDYLKNWNITFLY